MFANVPYIDPPIVNERVIDSFENNGYANKTISFLNICKETYQQTSTEETIKKEQIISEQIREVKKIQSFIDNIPTIFAGSSEQFVLSTFKEIRNGLIPLSLDLFLTDISQEDECMFMYGQKNDIKFFFNLFFEENDVETLVNVSTPNGKYVIEDNIENSIQRIFEIFQTEKIYEYLS
jgi:hypothetical protein